MTTRTRTYVRMAVSPATYTEIYQKMREAGYEHALHDESMQIDMHGIRVECDKDEGETVYQRAVRDAEKAREAHADDERRERIATAALSALLSRDQNHPSLGEAINRAARAADQLIEELGK